MFSGTIYDHFDECEKAVPELDECEKGAPETVTLKCEIGTRNGHLDERNMASETATLMQLSLNDYCRRRIMVARVYFESKWLVYYSRAGEIFSQGLVCKRGKNSHV